MMNALQRWMGVLQDSIFQLLPKLPLKQQDKLKLRIEHYVKNYEEPGSERSELSDLKVQKKEGEELLEDDEQDNLASIKSSMPLPEGVLKVNLGIPIVVVCSKIDLLLRGEKTQLLETNLEFI